MQKICTSLIGVQEYHGKLSRKCHGAKGRLREDWLL